MNTHTVIMTVTVGHCSQVLKHLFPLALTQFMFFPILPHHIPSHEIRRPKVCSAFLDHDVRGVGSCCEESLPPGQFHTEFSAVKARRAQGTCLSVGKEEGSQYQ